MFDGWVPAEVHETFDVAGNLTGQVVIHRQSEWDDESRARALALAEWESQLCTCGCGRPLLETAKKDQFYRVHKYTCAAGRAIEEVRLKDREKNKGAPEGWDAGLHYYAEPVDAPARRPEPEERRGH